MRLLVFILGIFYFVAAYASPTREFIIDTDVGIDDVIAISYFLQRPDINIKAITIECDGNAYCEPAYNNIKKLLAIFHRDTIPVASGRETALGGGHDFPSALKHSWDTFFDSPLADGKIKPATTDAKSLLITTLRSATKPQEILALGPLTTIAEVITQHPELKSKIRMIYYMGGAIHVPGNIIETDAKATNHFAEWNVYFDPKAARIVFHSGIPLTLVPLDVTNKLPLDKKFYAQIKNKRMNSEAANFLYKLMKRNQGLLFKETWYFWDPLAAVIASDETIASIKNLPLTVQLKPESQSGAVVVDKQQGHNTRVCLGVNPQKFKDTLLAAF